MLFLKLWLTRLYNRLTVITMNGVITYHSAINVGIGFSIVCVICCLEHSWEKLKPHFDVENAFYLKVHLSYFFLMALKYFKLHNKNGSFWHNDFLFVKNISKWTFTCSLYTCKIHFCMSEANWIITTNKKFLPQIYVSSLANNM